MFQLLGNNNNIKSTEWQVVVNYIALRQAKIIELVHKMLKWQDRKVDTTIDALETKLRAKFIIKDEEIDQYVKSHLIIDNAKILKLVADSVEAATANVEDFSASAAGIQTLEIFKEFKAFETTIDENGIVTNNLVISGQAGISSENIIGDNVTVNDYLAVDGIADIAEANINDLNADSVIVNSNIMSESVDTKRISIDADPESDEPSIDAPNTIAVLGIVDADEVIAETVGAAAGDFDTVNVDSSFTAMDEEILGTSNLNVVNVSGESTFEGKVSMKDAETDTITVKDIAEIADAEIGMATAGIIKAGSVDVEDHLEATEAYIEELDSRTVSAIELAANDIVADSAEIETVKSVETESKTVTAEQMFAEQIQLRDKEGNLGTIDGIVNRAECDENGLNINGNYSRVRSVTYSELVDLVESAKLVPGSWYRITDYVTIVNHRDAISAGYPFDILVLAIEPNEIAKEGYAIHNADADNSLSFDNAGMWKIWYSYNNNTELMPYASERGKGVIYRMIDEFGNDLPYDFKNIKFRRFVHDAIDMEGMSFNKKTDIYDDMVNLDADWYAYAPILVPMDLDDEDSAGSFFFTFDNKGVDATSRQSDDSNVIIKNNVFNGNCVNNVFLVSDDSVICDNTFVNAAGNTFNYVNSISGNEFNTAHNNIFFGKEASFNHFIACNNNVFGFIKNTSANSVESNFFLMSVSNTLNDASSNIVTAYFFRNNTLNGFYSNRIDYMYMVCGNSFGPEFMQNKFIGSGETLIARPDIECYRFENNTVMSNVYRNYFYSSMQCTYGGGTHDNIFAENMVDCDFTNGFTDNKICGVDSNDVPDYKINTVTKCKFNNINALHLITDASHGSLYGITFDNIDMDNSINVGAAKCVVIANSQKNFVSNMVKRSAVKLPTMVQGGHASETTEDDYANVPAADYRLIEWWFTATGIITDEINPNGI